MVHDLINLIDLLIIQISVEYIPLHAPLSLVCDKDSDTGNYCFACASKQTNGFWSDCFKSVQYTTLYSYSECLRCDKSLEYRLNLYELEAEVNSILASSPGNVRNYRIVKVLEFFRTGLPSYIIYDARRYIIELSTLIEPDFPFDLII